MEVLSFITQIVFAWTVAALIGVVGARENWSVGIVVLASFGYSLLLLIIIPALA